MRPTTERDHYLAGMMNLSTVCRELASKYQLTATHSTVKTGNVLEEGPISFTDAQQRLVASVVVNAHSDRRVSSVFGIDSVTLLAYSNLPNQEQFAEDFRTAYTKGDLSKKVEVQYLTERPL